MDKNNSNSVFRKRPRAARGSASAQDADEDDKNSPEKKAKATPAATATAATVATTPRKQSTATYRPAGNAARLAVEEDSSSSAEADNKIAAPPSVVPSPVATSPLRRTFKAPTAAQAKKEKERIDSAPPLPHDATTTTTTTTVVTSGDEGSTTKTTATTTTANTPKKPPRSNPFATLLFIALLCLTEFITYRAWMQERAEFNQTLRQATDRVAMELQRSYQKQGAVLQEQVNQAKQEARLFKTHVQQLQEQADQRTAEHAAELQAARGKAALEAREQLQSAQKAWDTEMAACTADLRSCHEKGTATDTQHQACTADLAALQHAVDRTRQELDQVAEQRTAWQEEALKTKEALEKAQQQQQACPDASSGNQERDDALQEAARLQTELDDLWKKATELEQNRNDWETLARRLDDEVVPESERQLAASQAEVERLAKMVEDDAAERHRLRTALHSLEDDKEDLLLQLRQLQEQQMGTH